MALLRVYICHTDVIGHYGLSAQTTVSSRKNKRRLFPFTRFILHGETSLLLLFLLRVMRISDWFQP
jgi:hypothetical protein